MTRRSSKSKAARRRLRERLLRQERALKSSGYTLVAGVDEAGRGPLAGPVVAGAVVFKDLDIKSEINDSKKLSAKKREKAFAEISEKAFVGIGVVDEKTIDEINIFQATRKAMLEALAKLEMPPDYVIVDGRMKIATKCPVKCIIGGDAKCLSIAAASIVAKVTRDRIMAEYDRLYPQYGFKQHKGYATLSHKRALRVHGPSAIHRNSFHPKFC
ncbi:MAG: ribonuclease HII [Candidatus Omnitrophica bacterium]|nr:ribonuclease HII [Candidatus Omnitrophota bacterium]